MKKNIGGNYGVILDVDLSKGKIEKKEISYKDQVKFLGGRGLGMKILWDRLNKPGMDPLGKENPLMFMPGNLCGLPVPGASRCCVVTKSPHTSPVSSEYPNASTITYSNVGGFLGPEIKFSGYDGIVITGKASSPVFLSIEDDDVKIRDAKKYWGMGTDEFDRVIIEDLNDRRFQTACIGPAGENGVSYASIIHTAARAAGRGGVGAVMGSKNLKAIAVKGSKQPQVASHEKFLNLLNELRENIKKSPGAIKYNQQGSTGNLDTRSEKGQLVVKNFREGTFEHIDRIGLKEIKKNWVRSFSCFCCPVSCKKSGILKSGPYAGLTHDGPEYETGTMLGSNLMITDIGGIHQAVRMADDFGIDAISLGNTIGFLMEAYEKGMINIKYLDGIDLKWGNIDGTLKLIKKIVQKDGIGNLASKGVKTISNTVDGSEAFAMHVKGHEMAAHNVPDNPDRALSYATANRGACHMSIKSARVQNSAALADAMGICFTPFIAAGPRNIIGSLGIVTGVPEVARAGETIFNLEKMFNYREGFRRIDDSLPDRPFEDAFTIGPKKGAVLSRESFKTMLDAYYKDRGWNPVTTKPEDSTLKRLGLSWT